MQRLWIPACSSPSTPFKIANSHLNMPQAMQTRCESVLATKATRRNFFPTVFPFESVLPGLYYKVKLQAREE